MPTFIRLASLTEQGIKNIRNFRDMLGEAKEIMEQHGVKLRQGWATLGDYDVVAVIDAPDAKTAAQVRENVAALEAGPLSLDQMVHVEGLRAAAIDTVRAYYDPQSGED